MSVGFAKTFKLERSILSKGLLGFQDNPKLSAQEQMTRMGVGNIKAKGYTGWLKQTGLRDNSSGTLTALAQTILKFDPYLEDYGTQCVLHYQLCHRGGQAGASVWFNLFNRFLPSHATFSRDQLSDYIYAYSGERNQRGLKDDVGLAFHCYTAPEALGILRLLDCVDETKQLYAAGYIDDIHPLIATYIIYDQRAKHYQGAATAPFKILQEDDGNIGKLFLVGEARLREIVEHIKVRYGLVTTLTSADLDEIGFTSSDLSVESLLAQYYSNRGY
jgi:hypothetical protein